MSVRDGLTLEPGAGPVRIGAGIADVFQVLPDGGLLAIATVSEGAIIVPAAGSTALRIIPRIDSFLQRGGDVDDEGVAAFVAALRAQLPASISAGLTGVPVADLPAVLETALEEHSSIAMASRLDQAAASAQEDRRRLDGAYRRARQDVEHPGQALPVEASDDLVTVMRLIGDHAGFSVTEPRGTGAQDGEGWRARLAALAHSSGVRLRPVRLQGNWEQPHATPYLAFLGDTPGASRVPDDGPPVEPSGFPATPVALLPGSHGYRIQRADGAPPRPLDDRDRAALSVDAFEPYAPLPRDRPVTWRDVAAMALRGTASEWRLIGAMSLAVAVLGMLTPVLTTMVLGTAVPEGRTSLLVQSAAALAVAAMAIGAFSLVQYFAMSRVAQRSTQKVQPALWDRVLSMPASFFRGRSTGELSVRVMAADSLQQLVNVQVVGAVLAAVFALLNVVLMVYYDLWLGLTGILILVVTLGVLWLALGRMQNFYTASIEAQLAGTSWIVQALTGIGKIRLAGAEARAQGRYLDQVRQQVVPLSRMTLVTGRLRAWFGLATALAPALFFVVVGVRWTASGPPVTASVFIALNTAYLAAFTAVAGLTAVITSMASAKPIFELLEPLMVALPESTTHKADPGRIEGRVELRNVEFRYHPDTPLVLDGLSLNVQPGEMVALVGPSGSGKSTTLRLLLGFEKPQEGQVLLDGRDLFDLDLDLVRAQMGVVTQDGEITRTSILKNILAGVNGDEEMAWRAAEAAALAEDIRAMPMKMETIVDPQLLSGGQAQRLLLARALVRQPSIVLLDEATSALDNESQSRVTEALDRLGATRIIIAHRLSTIRTADRILVVQRGQIVQEGTYAELMAVDGLFRDLAQRQQV